MTIATLENGKKFFIFKILFKISIKINVSTKKAKLIT